jgi:hypothetical protein
MYIDAIRHHSPRPHARIRNTAGAPPTRNFGRSNSQTGGTSLGRILVKCRLSAGENEARGWFRHARPCAGHPRLACLAARCGWPGTRASRPVFDGQCPAMTQFYVFVGSTSPSADSPRRKYRPCRGRPRC